VSGTTVIITLSATSAAAGSVVLVATAWDNTDTTDVNPTRLSVADAKGNTYARLREFVNGQAAAEAGAHIGLFYSILTTALASGDTITVTSDTARVAKAASAWNFSFGANSTVAVDAASDLANDGVDPGSMASSGLPSVERLYVRGTALERAVGGTWTVTTGFTDITGDGTSGAGAASNMSINGEFKIATSTGETSDPTGTAVDCASIFVALLEVASGPAAQIAYTPPYPPLLAQ